jgi:hypothetical protein
LPQGNSARVPDNDDDSEAKQPERGRVRDTVNADAGKYWFCAELVAEARRTCDAPGIATGLATVISRPRDEAESLSIKADWDGHIIKAFLSLTSYSTVSG